MLGCTEVAILKSGVIAAFVRDDWIEKTAVYEPKHTHTIAVLCYSEAGEGVIRMWLPWKQANHCPSDFFFLPQEHR